MKQRLKAFYMFSVHNFNGPVLITTAYFIFGFSWILFSDRILLKLSPNTQTYVQFQTYKGWLYIVITTILVYAFSKVYAIHKDKALNLSREKERIIAENLKENETLLKEIHHRVNNNLQMMISLLSLKKKFLSESRDSEIVKEMTDKIYAIALVHEMLYQTDLLSEVNFKAYIREITKHLLASLNAGKRVSINTDLDEIVLPVETAVPCGILMNEIISNTLKYAFQDRGKGMISIQLKIADSKKCRLQIRDDGIGFDTSAPLNKDHAFGMHLIHILSEQLHGELEISSNNSGTRYTLIFSV
jgi:two-component system, sensor histidine kinase PdtaS